MAVFPAVFTLASSPYVKHTSSLALVVFWSRAPQPMPCSTTYIRPSGVFSPAILQVFNSGENDARAYSRQCISRVLFSRSSRTSRNHTVVLFVLESEVQGKCTLNGKKKDNEYTVHLCIDYCTHFSLMNVSSSSYTTHSCVGKWKCIDTDVVKHDRLPYAATT
jgi:hypothetical protein